MSGPAGCGLLVAGTSPGCGKTVVTAGLVAALGETGFRAQAVQPLGFGHTDQAFLDTVTRNLQAVTPVVCDTPHDVDPVAWRRVLDCCQKMAYPPLVEVPGGVASPLRIVDAPDGPAALGVVTAVDLAAQLGFPLLLVTRKTADWLAEMLPALAWLERHGLPPVGWVAVETQRIALPYFEREALYLAQQFGVPLLGEIAYSPSVDVRAGRQGNLVRLTAEGVDLLPLRAALQAPVVEA